MIAQKASLAALENLDYYSSMASKIINTREFMIQEISKLNFVEKVYPSEANFICIKLKSSVINFLSYLELNNIYVRDRSNIKSMDNIFRVTILPNMDYPLEVFKKFALKELIL
jgi:histidinol-phosphate aminotransferase